MSFCQIDFKRLFRNDSLICVITNKFIKDKSWIKPKFKNDTVLIHEQGHFDIEEIYARKFRMQISIGVFNKSNLRTKIDSIYSIIKN